MSSACQVVFVNPHNENIGDSKMMNMMQTAPENRGVDVGSPNLRVPRIEIVEQPASKALRFRYECEGRSAGSIPGVHSTAENRTYPTVRIVGYTGNDDIVMIVSCVTKDAPHKAHPHNLVGRECKDGICSIFVDRETKTATFSNLGIQCVKKKDIESALKLRETKKVDPFKQGFEHAKNPSQIDLNSVRLCFQAIVKSQNARLLAPAVVSDPIYDKKAMSDLLITRLSHVSASVKGGTDVILLCEKVAKEDIKVRFYEETQGHQTWESFGDISLVHKQVAIAFKTPPYKTLEVDRTVEAFIQLFRPSDKATSESLPFKFTPIEPGPPRRKTPKLLDDLLQMDRIRTQNPTIFDNSTHATAFSVKSEPRSPPEFIPSPLAPVVCTSPYPECQASSTFQMSPNPIYNNPIPGSSSQLPQFGDFRQLPSESGSPFTKQDYINTEMHVGCSVIQPDLSMMGSQLLQLTTCAQTFPNQPEPNQNSFESYLQNMPTDNPMASVEERIDRNDLLNPGGLQELSESLSHVNISREDSLTRLTNEAFEYYERNFKQN